MSDIRDLRDTWQAATEEDRRRYELALRAIVARTDGVFDDPALLAFGALLPDIGMDCNRIAHIALGTQLPPMSKNECPVIGCDRIGRHTHGADGPELNAK